MALGDKSAPELVEITALEVSSFDWMVFHDVSQPGIIRLKKMSPLELGILATSGFEGGLVVQASSANWDDTYNTVGSNSANWDDARNTVGSNSANWDDARNTVGSNSANWDDTYNTVGSNSADWGPLVASKEAYVDGSRSDTYTEDGSIQFPFKTIQGAIDGTSGSITIHVCPLSYTEDLTISRGGINLISSDTASSRSALSIVGSITISIAAGGSTYFSGFKATKPSGSCLVTSGAADQKIFANNCSFSSDSLSAHHGCEDNNTGSGSLIIAHKCIFRTLDSSGGGMGFKSVGGGDRRFFGTNVLSDNQNTVVMHLAGSVTLTMIDEDVQGTVEIRDTANANFNRVLFIGLFTPLVDTTSTAVLPSTMQLCTIASAAPVAVSGTGKFTHAFTGFVGVEGAFAATLDSGSGATAGRVRGAGNIMYDNTVTGLTAENVQEAIDELNANIGGLSAGGGDVEEAPEDGTAYARQDAGWVSISALSGIGGDPNVVTSVTSANEVRISRIQKMTQAHYDLITPDADVLYVIVG